METKAHNLLYQHHLLFVVQTKIRKDRHDQSYTYPFICLFPSNYLELGCSGSRQIRQHYSAPRGEEICNHSSEFLVCHGFGCNQKPPRGRQPASILIKCPNAPSWLLWTPRSSITTFSSLQMSKILTLISNGKPSHPTEESYFLYSQSNFCSHYPKRMTIHEGWNLDPTHLSFYYNGLEQCLLRQSMVSLMPHFPLIMNKSPLNLNLWTVRGNPSFSGREPWPQTWGFRLLS